LATSLLGIWLIAPQVAGDGAIASLVRLVSGWAQAITH